MELKRLLKRTWVPFFSRYGRLHKIQEMAIPRIVAGENVILVSPSASGKTEAAVAPVLERLLGEDFSHVGLLYISPTRALVNDLEVRLRDPVESLGLTLAVRTGDRPGLKTGRPENLLITTPESFDSLLCRFPGLFSGTRSVILDEIHLLDNTYRGDQLICLLERLRYFHNRNPVQYVALSATLHDPAATSGRYFDGATVIDTKGRRAILWKIVDDLGSAVSFLRDRKLHKALLFCNSRKETERLSVELAELWPKDRILVHHGSLSRRQREDAERTFRLWDWGICVATMTLEIGVDIGDIDATLLFRPPPTPSSFLQRAGRSRRKSKEMSVICISPDEEEQFTFRRYIEMASEGMIEVTGYVPDPSVCVQQTFSMLYGHRGGVSKKDLHRVLSRISDRVTIERILAHLTENGFIEPGIRGGLRATTRLMDMGERGIIHSNIPDAKEYRIVDIISGGTIGRVVLQATTGSTFLLSGKAWEVVETGRDRLGVRPARQVSSRTHFTRRLQMGAFTSYLPEETHK